ncbi:c-type cytochrome domain-containing protein [Adhaeribacter radiodurans]|uniref:Ribonuclease inhibitor n=1 Tax=Adhaeribacter radiodurans TaxID=2745197 RepID=A0A7L7L749_9BACT|nr:c-type cytochrome domain-containing protein [Adhaeribacter radiodurans]QMU28603.1 ribonuclease inhibitor [Adhaeribacter radiodurans]
MVENLIQFFGRLHPLIVHLPIGILMLAIALQLLVNFAKYARFREFLPLLWFAGFISGVMACLAGFMLKQDGGYDEEAVDLHQFLGIALTLLTGFVFLIQSQRFPQKLLVPGVLLATLFLIGTGHYGGNLTHGEDYLSQPLTALMGQTPAKKIRKPITNLNEAVVYADLVEPVLEQKCYQCHSSKKQKGDLRLDSPENILKGGEHGKIIIGGKADESDIYKRLILPEEDDDRMPPKGKPQLTESEVQLIHWWIEQGAGDFNKKVAEVPQDDKVKIVLSSLTKEADPKNSVAEIPEIPKAKVKLPDNSVLQQIKNLGVVVSPLTRDNSYVALNMVNAPNFSDADIQLLAKLSDNIIWLDMSETKITDNGLVHLKKLKNLTRLSLDQTAVSDAGLSAIQSLTHLKYLNLYGTKVTDQGLKILASCKSLKSIYLWQTKVTSQGVAALQKQVGQEVEINFGTDTL